jgi:hypothetical protein
MTTTWCATHTLRRLFPIIFNSSIFDDAVCNPHAALSVYFIFLFLSMLFDDAVCNPHAALSVCPFIICLTTRCATHTPRCSFIFISFCVV